MEQQALQELIELPQIAWIIFSTVLVLFMQAGFLCVEAGVVRKKNNINVAIKAMMNICASFAIFFIAGYSLMYGDDRWMGTIGEISFFLFGLEQQELSNYLFQAALCGVALAIISGGIAERCKFLSSILMSIIFTLFIYPVFGHWVWGGGWLSEIGFYDFAGASVIHIVGAGVALAGIKVLGPRVSRINKQGKLVDMIAPNPPMIALGVIILFIGWIGIVGGAEKLNGNTISILINTIISACFGGLTALLSTWAYSGIASMNILYRGLLGGLVAITASADVVSIQSSMLIGIAGGFVVPLISTLMDRYKLDDAVGVVPVHGAAGIVGIILVPVFITPDSLVLLNQSLDQSLTKISFILVQTGGAIVCLLWSYVMGYIMWKFFSKITIFNLRPEEEKIGLNYTEHMSTDPLHDLNIAVDLVRREQVLEAKTHFDRLENSDLEGLSAALRELLNRDHRDL